MPEYDLYIPVTAYRVYRVKAETAYDAFESFDLDGQEPDRTIIEDSDSVCEEPDRVEEVL